MEAISDDKTEAAIRRKESAERLLADPLFVEAFDKVADGIIGQMKSDRLEAEDALRLALSLKLLDKVRGAIRSYIANGKVALHDLRAKQLQDVKEAQAHGQ